MSLPFTYHETLTGLLSLERHALSDKHYTRHAVGVVCSAVVTFFYIAFQSLAQELGVRGRSRCRFQHCFGWRRALASSGLLFGVVGVARRAEATSNFEKESRRSTSVAKAEAEEKPQAATKEESGRWSVFRSRVEFAASFRGQMILWFFVWSSAWILGVQKRPSSSNGRGDAR